MKYPLLLPLVFTLLAASGYAVEFKPVPDWAKLPEAMPKLGNMHGDVAVSSAGDIYVSLMDPSAGIVVFAPDGKYLRKLAGAPNDFHGFVIRKDQDGEFIYGPRLATQSIVKLTLEGKLVLEIPASAIPDKLKMVGATEPPKNVAPPVPGAPGVPEPGKPYVRLTGMDVAPNGDLYITDGYASSYIHRFDRSGKHLASFGGKEAPYGFRTLHKILVDTRFSPPRLVATDRENMRLVHLSLDGAFLGVVATDLLRPSALALHGDYLAVGELRGRVTVLDKAGQVVARVGANSVAEEIGTNRTDPARWRPGVINAAHGVNFNAQGDLFVAEWTLFGRLHRYNRM